MTDHVTERSDAPSVSARAAHHFIAFREGDRLQLGLLVDVLTPLLWHTARASGASSELVHDALQNAWMKLLAKANTIESPTAVTAWMMTTVRREVYALRKRERRHDSLDESPIEQATTHPTHNPEALVVGDDSMRRLWGHVSALPEVCQRLLRALAAGTKPDYATLSEGLGLAVGSIGPTRARCLKKLRAALLADDTTGGTTTS